MVHRSQINSQTLVSSANFYTHALLASYSTVQDGPRRVATNPMLNHLELLGVIALLVSRYNLHGSELVLHVGVGCCGCDRSSEYMREELTSGIIHPWAPTDVVEHVQSNVQGVSYTDGDERENCVSVRYGYVCHAAQAIFFPVPRKDDVVSHRMTEWNSGSDSDFSRPNLWMIS